MEIKNNTFYKNNFSQMHFGSQRTSKQTYEMFMQFAKETDFANNLKSIVSNPENYCGEGLSNYVYKIPHNDTFLLRFSKKIPFENISGFRIKKLKDVFPDINVGQPIAEFRKGFTVIIKQDGVPNGRCHYPKKAFSETEIPEFVDKIKNLSMLEQEKYDSFFKEVKAVSKKGYSIDCYNSNNLLVGNELNMVDVEKHGIIKKGWNVLSKDSFMNLFLDQSAFLKTLSKLDEVESKKLRNSAKIILQKISTAMKKEHLNDNTFQNTIVYFGLWVLNGAENHFFENCQNLKKLLSSW